MKYSMHAGDSGSETPESHGRGVVRVPPSRAGLLAQSSGTGRAREQMGDH